MNNPISDIASIITEDPDILVELNSSMNSPMDAVDPGMEQPSTSTDVERQAEEIGGEDPDPQIRDQIRDQEEAGQQQQNERQRLIDPQMQELQDTVGQLDDNITQGVASIDKQNRAFNGLDSDMSAIQAILQSLETQI